MYKIQLDSSSPEQYTLSIKNFTHLMDQYLQYIDTLDDSVSTEALSNSLMAVFTAMIDLFGRFMNTAKTNIFKFPRSLKRSEIRAYTESHAVMVQRIERSSFDKFMTAEIDVPSRMSATYLSATSNLNSTLTTIGISDLSARFITMMKSLIIDINGSKDYENPFTSSATNVMAKLTAATKLYNIHLKDYMDKPGKKKPFSKVFHNMKELKELRVTLLDMEKNLLGISAVQKRLDTLDAITSKLFSVVNNNAKANVSKKFVRVMANFLKAQAIGYEMYGELVSAQMALEHNYTEVMETLYSFDPAG